MAAGDIILFQRNSADNQYLPVVVPVRAGQPLTFNALKTPNAGAQPLEATATNVTTAGAGTYSAAAIVGGLITRDPNGGDRTDTTATAALILAAAQAVGLLVNNYDSLFFTVINTADAAETITLAGGVGVTLQGIGTIGQNSMDKFELFRTSSTTLVMRKA